MTTTVQDPIPLEFNKLDGAFLPQLDQLTLLKHRLHQSRPLEIDALGSPPPLQLQSDGQFAVRPFPLEERQKLVMGHERDCHCGLRATTGASSTTGSSSRIGAAVEGKHTL